MRDAPATQSETAWGTAPKAERPLKKMKVVPTSHPPVLPERLPPWLPRIKRLPPRPPHKEAPSEVSCREGSTDMAFLQHYHFSMGLIDMMRDSGRVVNELSRIINELRPELQPDNEPRSSLGIRPGLDDAVGPRREFFRRFAEGIGKLARSMSKNHRKKTG
ncbi:hypothetical protein B296_00002668 [Ensete ventricosum]|uniref:Uncharacterized protein n=1 Tax=Ensete ventricosum TaxID=4639 RepID=A0A427A8L8_ENSVE|nr:hypothetical protein B296_00002668 [Ensete ventricosum]